MTRVALVTGGTRGIGAAIARGLAGAGHKVAATYAGNRERAEARPLLFESAREAIKIIYPK